MALIAVRSERVGVGPLTFNLVHGETIPDGLPDDVVQALVESSLVLDTEETTDNPFGQEARAGAPVVEPPAEHIIHPGEVATTPDSPPPDPTTTPTVGELPGQVPDGA